MPLSSVPSRCMATEPLRVSVVFAPAARKVLHEDLVLQAGSTVKDALRACTLLQTLTNRELDEMTVSVWGRKEVLEHRLKDLDRLEICRPLKVDPKLARRQRFARQGSKSAGLFATRRPGAKAGY